MIKDYQGMIEAYENLRLACWEAMRKDRALLGADQWLHSAISVYDISEMTQIGDVIFCAGSSYTLRTGEIESFSFSVPIADLEKE